MRSTVIVTGASGFIGGRIAYYYGSLGYKVLAPLRTGSRLLLPNQNIVITSYEHMGDFLHGKTSLAIIHCAALTTANSNDENLIYTTNIRLAELVADWVKTYQPTILIYLSTVSIYGEIRESFLRVDTAPNAPNSYGLSKLTSEILLTDRCISQNIPISIVRLPGTVGYGSHGNIISKIISTILSYKIDSKAKKLLLSNPDRLFNNIVAIDSLLDYIYLLIREAGSKPRTLTTLLGSTMPIPFKDVVDYIASSFAVRNLESFSWTGLESSSFIIDPSHAILHGFTATSTTKSLDMVKFDICNPPGCC